MCQEIIFEEDERIEEIIMFETGHIDIGYDIGKRRLFKMRMKEKVPFGAFNITF